MSVVRRTSIGVAIGGLAAGALSGSAGAAATAADKAHAQQALVTLSDLGTGWTSTPTPSTSAGGFSGASKLANCLGVSAKLIGSTPPRAISPLFQGAGGSEVVQDTVSIYPSAAYARAVQGAISSPKAAGCLNAEMNRGATKSTGHVTVKRLSSPTGTTAFTLVTTVSGATTPSGPSHTTKATTNTEVVYFFKGRFGNGLDVEASGSKAPVALTQQLLAVARGRL